LSNRATNVCGHPRRHTDRGSSWPISAALLVACRAASRRRPAEGFTERHCSAGTPATRQPREIQGRLRRQSRPQASPRSHVRPGCERALRRTRSQTAGARLSRRRRQASADGGRDAVSTSRCPTIAQRFPAPRRREQARLPAHETLARTQGYHRRRRRSAASVQRHCAAQDCSPEKQSRRADEASGREVFCRSGRLPGSGSSAPCACNPARTGDLFGCLQSRPDPGPT
jgi:hypothetical protein